MKRTTTLLMSAALIGMITVSCGSKQKDANEGSSANETPELVGNVEYNGKIVYVEMDSIARSYGLAIDLQADFNAKTEKADAELKSKARSLQRDAQDLQDKANKGLLTSYQISTRESALKKQEQDVVNYRDKMGVELEQGRMVVLNEISEAIMAYLKKYNAEKGYSMIISSTAGSTVLLADPSLNITGDVIKGLNEEYEAKLNQKTPAANAAPAAPVPAPEAK